MHWLRRSLSVGLILHGLAHAGAGMWLTHQAYAHGQRGPLLGGAVLWTWVTVRFARAGFALPRKARVAGRLAFGAALLSLVLLAFAWSPAMWFGLLVDAVILLTVGLTSRTRWLLLRLPRDRAPLRPLRHAATAVIGASTLLWPWYAHWNSSPAEVRAVLPGDESMMMMPHDVAFQSAVTIHAPPDRVWSWLVQIGQDRGGFYSYDALENVFGLRVHSAERIDPAWQQLHEGDRVRAVPDGWFGSRNLGWTVWRLDEGRLLVLRYWGSFVLAPEGDGKTRLIARTPLGDPRDHVVRAGLGLVWEPLHFVMERKMLLGIKERAERPTPAPPAFEEPRASIPR